MKKLLAICIVLGLVLAVSGTAQAEDPIALSNSLAEQLKNNQVDCDGEGTNDLWKDTWTSSKNPTGWDEYSLVIGANAIAGLKLHGDTTESDNAVNYLFVTNKNWAKKTQEEPIVGTGGSAFYADSSYTGEDSWGKAWGFHGQDWSGTGRNSSPEGLDNMLIGTYNFSIAGYYTEAALLADAIIGQTDPDKPWKNNGQYWAGRHIEFDDNSWYGSEVMSNIEFMRALQKITDGGGKDYSAVITNINDWKGGEDPNNLGNNFGSWNDAIDYYFDPDYDVYDDHYDDIFKLLANWDTTSAQGLADNFDPSNPYFSYAIANVWAIDAMAANDQESFASMMTGVLVGKYWDGSDVTAKYPNRCRGALLMANEIAPVPEPATMLLLGSGLIGLAGLGRKKFFKKS